MYKPNGFEQATSDSDYKRLKAGGYVCEIKDAKEVQGTSKNGNEYHVLELMFDICEGEFANYFTKQYKANKLRNEGKRETRWYGRHSVFFEEKENHMTSAQFKGFINAVENSNQGFRVNWSADYGQLKGKKIGLLFREEEYESPYDGSVKTRVSACKILNADQIRNGDFEIPQKKVLVRKSVTAEYNGFTEASAQDLDLPF